MAIEFRKARLAECDEIWEILQYAIQRRKEEGSQQWQAGYPNPSSVQHDMEQGWAYVLVDEIGILAYGAVIFDIEPAYEEIEGKWLSEGNYVVLHRIAAAPRAKGMGIATQFFNAVALLAKSKEVFSIKVDTNYDNIAMLTILDRLGYQYCGEVYFNGSARRAFEKLI